MSDQQQGALWSQSATTEFSWIGMRRWRGGIKRRERRKRAAVSRLSLVKRSEMILPSVLSEASSLVAERKRERERGRRREKK